MISAKTARRRAKRYQEQKAEEDAKRRQTEIVRNQVNIKVVQENILRHIEEYSSEGGESISYDTFEDPDSGETTREYYDAVNADFIKQLEALGYTVKAGSRPGLFHNTDYYVTISW